MLLQLAWRNLWRNPARSLLTILALGGGLVMVLLYAALLEGLSQQMEHAATALTSGKIQIHRQRFIEDQDLYATLSDHYLQQLDTVEEIVVAPRLYAAGLASSDHSSTSAMIRAIDPQRERRVTRLQDHLRSGSASLDSQIDATHQPVLIGARMAKQLQLSVGDELILVTQAADGSIGNGLFRIEGILRPIDPALDRNGVVMSIGAFRQLMALEQGVHELAISITGSAALESVQQQVAAMVKQSVPLQDAWGGEVVVRNWRQLTPAVADLMEMSSGMMGVIGLIIIALASLGMINTMMMAIHERTHEFGILLAIGMGHLKLLGMVLLESLLLALVAALSGALVGIWLCDLLAEHGIDFSAQLPDGYDWGGLVFEPVMYGELLPHHLLLAVVLLVVVTLLAALIPAWRTLRLKPVEAIQ